MNNTINVNYMTRTYSNFLKNNEVKGGKPESPSFCDRVAEKSQNAGLLKNALFFNDIAETGRAEAVSTKDMTMDEYKRYIHEKISQIPMHPSRMQESISIHISEVGFEAMKNDPEYEAWVLNDLRTGWAQPDRWSGICGGAYSTIYYGATKEECHAQMWSAGYQNGSGKSLFDGRAKDSFWERRTEQKKRTELQMKKEQEKKRAQVKRQQQELLNEKAAKAEQERSRLEKAWSSKQQMAKAFSAYESNIMTETVAGGDSLLG